MGLNEEIRKAVDVNVNEAIFRAGGMPDGFLAIVAFIDSEGHSKWTVVQPAGQRIMHAMGLADVLMLDAKDAVLKAIDGSHS